MTGRPLSLRLLTSGASPDTSTRMFPIGPREPGAPHTPSPAEPAPARSGLTRAEVLIGLVCLAAALAEGAANDWLALLLVDVHGAPQAFGALVLTAFNVTMTVGRLAGGPFIDRFGRAVLVRGGGLVAAVGIATVTMAPSLGAALVGGLLWGLGISAVFPAAMSAAGEVPGRGNRAITVVSTIAYGAFLFGGPSIGVLAEAAGLDRALSGVALSLGLARYGRPTEELGSQCARMRRPHHTAHVPSRDPHRRSPARAPSSAGARRRKHAQRLDCFRRTVTPRGQQ